MMRPSDPELQEDSMRNIREMSDKYLKIGSFIESCKGGGSAPYGALNDLERGTHSGYSIVGPKRRQHLDN